MSRLLVIFFKYFSKLCLDQWGQVGLYILKYVNTNFPGVHWFLRLFKSYYCKETLHFRFDIWPISKFNGKGKSSKKKSTKLASLFSYLGCLRGKYQINRPFFTCCSCGSWNHWGCQVYRSTLAATKFSDFPNRYLINRCQVFWSPFKDLSLWSESDAKEN